MKLPKRIKELLDKKAAFLDEQRTKLESSVVRQQSKLFNNIISELIPELDVKDGLIQETVKNYRLISILDKTYKDFQDSSSRVFLGQIVTTTGKIATLSQTYYTVMLSELPSRFDNIVANTDKLINLRLGLDGGELVRGGFLQSFFDSNTIGTELKQMTSKAVTSHTNMKDYINMLGNKINGTDETTGGLERQFQRFGYDLYQQYDRAYNESLGTEFGFKYFIYQGGLVKDSREFCVEHNNNVYSIDEAKEWVNWKSPTTGERPSYMNYAGYNPMIDFGGYNCRHFAGFLSDEIAFDMRPDLKASE
jgi:hypothetical protein